MAANDRTALVTGASSGIGLEFARLLAKDGYRLVLVARSEDKLGQLAKDFKEQYSVDSLVVVADLSKQDGPRDVFTVVRDANLNVDVLINNAGYTVFGEFAEADLERELDMLQVNMVALTFLTKLFLTGMKQRKKGRILNVASTAAFQPGPLMACYYATKAYVLSFSEALACELEGTGVTVTCLCPGPTETGFANRGGASDSGLFKDKKVMGAAEVAMIGYRAMMRGQAVVIAGLKNQLLVLSVRFSPRALIPRIVRAMQGARAH